MRCWQGLRGRDGPRGSGHPLGEYADRSGSPSKTLAGNVHPRAGNAPKALKGDRAGAFSIRINDQWRLYFRWDEGDAHDVEIADYH